MSSDEDMCSICLSDLQCPRVLPCSHSFCHQCLHQHIIGNYNTTTVCFECPLCRRSHHAPSLDYPILEWASCYPINIFAKIKCNNHDVSVDAICFCHDVHLCFRCLLKSHRTCCLSINPARKEELISYFGDSSRKALIWKKRLIYLRKKKKMTPSNVAYINKVLVDLEQILHSMVIDREIVKQQDRESDTIKLISEDFEIFESSVASNVRPQPYSEFCVSKKEFTESCNPLLLQKLLADDRIIGGFSEESKIFMLSPEGENICEVLLSGELISLDIFDDDLIIALTKVKPSSTIEENCLQFFEYTEKQIIPIKSHLVKSYSQIMALSEDKIIALYYEDQWIIDILQINNSNIIIDDKYILKSNVRPQIQRLDSQYIIYTNDIEVFQVNLHYKTEVCLLSKILAQRNFIERVSCLAVAFSIIFITDIVNGVVYKLSSQGTYITIFLKEKMKTEKISSFHFNACGHILTCFEDPQHYTYCLYNEEDFDWTEDS